MVKKVNRFKTPFVSVKKEKPKVLLTSNLKSFKKLKYWRTKNQAINFSEKQNKNQKAKFHVFSKQIAKSGTRRYFSTSYQYLIKHFKKLIDCKSMYIHEQCNPNYKTKIFLDLDCKIKNNESLDFFASCSFLIKKMCEFLKKSFHVNVTESDATILTACRSDKYSAHIVFNNKIMAKDLKSLGSIVHTFISWIVMEENQALIKMSKEDFLSLISGKSKRVGSMAIVDDLKSGAHFISMVDTQVYVNGSLRTYYSKNMYFDTKDFQKEYTKCLNTKTPINQIKNSANGNNPALEIKKKMINKENSSRLYYLSILNLDNEINYIKNKKFNLAVFEKSLLQNEYDLSFIVNEKNKKKDLEKKNDSISKNIKNFTIIHSRFDQCYEIYNETASKILFSYHKTFTSLLKKFKNDVNSEKSVIFLKEFESMIKLNLKTFNPKCNYKNRGEFNSVSANTPEINKLIQSIILPKYIKYLKDSIPLEDFVKLNVSYVQNSLKFDKKTRTRLIINIKGSRCLIYIKNNKTYHTQKLGSGIYLVVNMKTRHFYQACHKDKCYRLKAGLEVKDWCF